MTQSLFSGSGTPESPDDKGITRWILVAGAILVVLLVGAALLADWGTEPRVAEAPPAPEPEAKVDVCVQRSREIKARLPEYLAGASYAAAPGQPIIKGEAVVVLVGLDKIGYEETSRFDSQGTTELLLNKGGCISPDPKEVSTVVIVRWDAVFFKKYYRADAPTSIKTVHRASAQVDVIDLATKQLTHGKRFLGPAPPPSIESHYTSSVDEVHGYSEVYHEVLEYLPTLRK
jgi:hypothetical protein